MFYEMMGWDVETGLPTKATLIKFGLEDCIAKMEEVGLTLK